MLYGSKSSLLILPVSLGRPRCTETYRILQERENRKKQNRASLNGLMATGSNNLFLLSVVHLGDISISTEGTPYFKNTIIPGNILWIVSAGDLNATENVSVYDIYSCLNLKPGKTISVCNLEVKSWLKISCLDVF